MNTLLTVVLPLAQQAPPAEDVKPGWVAFGIVLLLAAAVVFLALSLRKHLGRVNFEEEPRPHHGDPAAPAHRDDKA